MSTIRQPIIDSLVTTLKSVNAGSTLTLQGRSHLCSTTIVTAAPWRLTPFLAEECPAAFVQIVNTETRHALAGSLDEHDITVAVWLFVKGSELGTVITPLISDVLAAIGQDYSQGGRLISLSPTGNKVDMTAKGEVVAAAELTFSGKYRTDRWAI